MKTLTAATSALLLATAGLAHAGDMDGKKAKYDGMKKAQMSDTAPSDMDNSALFDSLDADRNRTIDFTEFSNYMEREYGITPSESAKEYVRLSGSEGVITDTSFAGVDARMFKHTHLKSGETHNGMKAHKGMKSDMGSTQSASSMGNSSMSTTQNTAVMGATSVNYGSFGDYDRNGDGMVNFGEYSQYRKKAGIRTTQAAQEFIRFTNGQASFTQSDFDSARSMDVLSRPYYRSN